MTSTAEQTKEGVIVIKVGQILDLSLSNLNEGLITLANQPLRASVSFRLKGVFRQISEHFKSFNEARVELCEKLGTLNEKGTAYNLGENQEEFDKQLSELLVQDIEIQSKQISLFDLGDAQLSVTQIEQIGWLISE